MARNSAPKKSTTPTPKKRVPVENFGDRLRRARLMAEMTIKEAGDIIGVSPATISSWERQAWKPRYGVDLAVGALADAYEADAQWIVTGERSSDSELWGEKPNPSPTVSGNPYKRPADGSGNGDRSPDYPERGADRPDRHLAAVR